MNKEVKKIIKRWFEKAKHEVDDIDRFIALWISFNAFYACGNLTENENVQLKTIKTKYRCFFPDIVKDNDSFFQEFADYIVSKPINKGFIQDLRYSINSPKQEKKVYINLDCINEFIDCVYQIRCNLFHGGKSLEDGQDRKLVCLAYNCLICFLDTIFGQEKI